MAHEIVIEHDGIGERLDKFLVQHLAVPSRSHVQKLIAQGSILVNGKMVSAHYTLRIGDRIAVTADTIRVQAVAARHEVPVPSILFENESILVINKPAGLTVHAGAGVRGPTLVDWLRQHIPTIASVGDDPKLRPGIVHRLDQDVSGVMVIAKTQESFEHLKKQFKERTIEKEYLALVHGIPQKHEGVIDFRVERSRRQHGRMAARPVHAEGREARTHYTTERTIKNMTLLRLRPETGRTHQLRVHLKALGHPVVGDTVYATKPFRKKPSNLKRPFLHAARLRFTDIDGTVREFNAPLPGELRAYL